MATGTGTQSDPRVVYNWSELADAFQNYNYIELGGDINAPQESASLVGGREKAVSLNGKGLATMSSIQLTVCEHDIEFYEKPYDPTTQEDYLYSITNNEVSIIHYLGNNLNPAIPDTIEGLPVRRLYTTAFNYSNVKAVYIPDSVIEIQ